MLLIGHLNGLCTMSRGLLSGYSISAIVHEKMKKDQMTGKKGLDCQTARKQLCQVVIRKLLGPADLRMSCLVAAT